MLFTRLYYTAKPWLPWGMRIALRRWRAKQLRRRHADTWPILQSAARKPDGWPGWPDGKQFAVVLTHDVEGPDGLAKVKKLAELEMSLGFRSSFNLIPEGGEYQASQEYRDWLTNNGFEVGVHDLYHDGKLYRDREQFRANAQKINRYLKDWNAVGFRSGFMHHNLDWLHDLNVLYDSSTFDTDPFEPQPDGVGTIFPFWVPAPSSDTVLGPRSSVIGSPSSVLRPPPSDAVLGPRSSVLDSPSSAQSRSSVLGPRSSGYVELPYTLPQDMSMFLLFREQSIDLWKRKVEWIAEHGGMVLVNLHPDYMAFEGDQATERNFPVRHYVEFLELINSRYRGQYWQALPRNVSTFCKAHVTSAHETTTMKATATIGVQEPKPKIWIDLDNTPHVPFFEPIIEELNARGYPVVVTARDAFQVCDLADKKRMPYIKVGRHYGKNRLMKGLGLAYRAAQLAPVILREKPAIGVSHGARSQLLLGNWLRLPTILIEDYEYCQFPPMMRPTWVMAPSVIPDTSLCHANGSFLKYPGIKEDVYAWKLNPDAGILGELGLSEKDLVVTVRPPATEAHYHNPESEKLFAALMDRACQTPNARVVLLPRNNKQSENIRAQNPRWFENNKTVVPKRALDGMNLIWHSDLVVSGGGTMNREAAALRVPVYSIFRGTIGAVDRHLEKNGRLTLIASEVDVDRKILLEKRLRKSLTEVTSKKTLESIVLSITELAEKS